MTYFHWYKKDKYWRMESVYVEETGIYMAICVFGFAVVSGPVCLCYDKIANYACAECSKPVNSWQSP